MTEKNGTTLYVPKEIHDKVTNVHQTVADKSDLLPLYSTVEADLEALVEKQEKMIEILIF